MENFFKENDIGIIGTTENNLYEIWKNQQLLLKIKLDQIFIECIEALDISNVIKEEEEIFFIQIELTEFVLDELDTQKGNYESLFKEFKNILNGHKKIEIDSLKYDRYINWINGKCNDFFFQIFVQPVDNNTNDEEKKFKEDLVKKFNDLVQNNNKPALYNLISIVGYNGITKIIEKLNLSIKYENFGITEENIKEIILTEEENKIDPDKFKEIEKMMEIDLKSETSESSNKSIKLRRKTLLENRQKLFFEKKISKKMKKQKKKEKRLEHNKFLEKIKTQKEQNDDLDITEREKTYKSPFHDENFLLKIREYLTEENCQENEIFEIKINDIERNLHIANNIINLENKDEKKWFYKIKSLWDGKKDKILLKNDISCELIEEELIEFLENIQNEIKINYLLRKFLRENNSDLLTKNYSQWEKQKKAIEDIKELINNWIPNSHKNDNIKNQNIAKLVIFGSQLYGAETIDSNINGIIFVPYKIYWDTQFVLDFFGDFDCILEINSITSKCENKLKKGVMIIKGMEEGDNSLFCKLCQNKTIKNLRRIYSRVPLIKFKFNNFEFVLHFVTLNSNSLNKLFKNEENNLTTKGLDEAINIFRPNIPDLTFQNDKEIHYSKSQMAMIISLSSLRSNFRIIELLGKNIEKFQILHITLTLWTKKNFIYGSQYGFFNCPTISILVTKVIIENQSLSITILIKKLFENLINWSKLPLNEAKIIKLENPIFWNLNEEIEQHQKSIFFNDLEEKQKEKNLKTFWPIITPGFPSQNVCYNINASTEIIIQKEIENVIDKFNKLENEFENLLNDKYNFELVEKAEKIWKNWFDGGKFEEKYNNYLVLICSHKNKSIYGSQFCDYTGTRIRLELLSVIENNNSNIEYCHTSPPKYFKNHSCPRHLKKNSINGGNCTVWLIGIKEIFESDNLENFFDTNGNEMNKFKNDIIYFFHKGAISRKKVDRGNYRLNTMFLKKEELENWKLID